MKYVSIASKIASDLNVANDIIPKFENVPIITIFGSARIKEEHHYYQETMKLAKKCVEAGYGVCTGGGPGLMEAGARGAFEANGHTLGLSIVLPHEQKPNEYLSENITFQNFAQRKIVFSSVSNGYIVVPGGYGTLDELFEVLTLMQCQVTRKKPVVLFGVDFWTPLLTFIKEKMISEKTISPDDVNLIFMTDSVDDAIQYLIDNAPKGD